MKTISGSRTLVVLAATAVIAFSASTGAVASGLITSKQIKDNTITTADIKNGTITSADLAPGTAISGPQGPAGAAGAAGAPGKPGTAGISGYEVVDSVGTAVQAGTTGDAAVPCPTGKKVIAVTGFFVNGNDGIAGEVSTDETTALVFAKNTTSADDTLVAEAVCAFVN